MNTVLGLIGAGMECGGLGQAAAEIKASCIILLVCTILIPATEGFVMSEKIYLKIDQRRFVKKPKVTIGDVITVYCKDKDMIEKSDI